MDLFCVSRWNDTEPGEHMNHSVVQKSSSALKDVSINLLREVQTLYNLAEIGIKFMAHFISSVEIK